MHLKNVHTDMIMHVLEEYTDLYIVIVLKSGIRGTSTLVFPTFFVCFFFSKTYVYYFN